MDEENPEEIQALMEILSSSSSDSEDEELFAAALLQNEKRVVGKVKNFESDVLDQYDEIEFKQHFRISKNTFDMLVNMFKESEFFPKSDHGGKITKSAKVHVAAFLWFAGNKSVLRTVSQLFDASISTIFCIINRVMSFLRSIGPNIIKFPRTEADKEAIQNEFLMIAGFPGVLGCVDGTYINMRTPAGKLKSTYVNRHDQTSLTLQGICDAKKRFLDAFTGVSSKMHDSTVYKTSFIRQTISNLEQRYHLLGDAAYPISPHLITPYRDYGNLTPSQINFNYRFSKTRVKIENTFGLLKGRFRQLMLTEFWGIQKTSEFILCCCILHNICIDNNDFIEEVVAEENQVGEANYVEEREVVLKRLGEIKRDTINQEFELHG